MNKKTHLLYLALIIAALFAGDQYRQKRQAQLSMETIEMTNINQSHYYHEAQRLQRELDRLKKQ